MRYKVQKNLENYAYLLNNSDLSFIGHAFKYCTEKGEWWSPPNQTKSYSHYHKCNDEQEIAVRNIYCHICCFLFSIQILPSNCSET